MHLHRSTHAIITAAVLVGVTALSACTPTECTGACAQRVIRYLEGGAVGAAPSGFAVWCQQHPGHCSP